MFQLLYLLVHSVIHLIQPLVVPFCFAIAWLLIALVGWTLWSAGRASVERARQMHQIPCANCQFFTHNYQLKCPVHPSEALSDEAIGCTDYEPHTASSRFS